MSIIARATPDDREWRIRAVPVTAVTADAEGRCVGAAGAANVGYPMLHCSDGALRQ